MRYSNQWLRRGVYGLVLGCVVYALGAGAHARLATPPIVTNPGDQTNAEGDTVSLPLVAADPDGDAITYSATGLPPSLTVDPGTGLISGTLSYTSAGVHTVSVTATAAGASDTETLTWTVTDVDSQDVLAPLPGPASPVSPSGSIATPTPAFTWSAVANASYYLLAISDAAPASPTDVWYTPAQAGCASGTGVCTVAAPRTLRPGLVSWAVLTWNSRGYGPWSSPMDAVLEAGDGALEAPTPIEPSGAVATPTPTYSWNPLSDVIWYQLSVTDAFGSESEFWYSPGQACPSSPCEATPNVLLAIGLAEWRMRAWSTRGAGAWTTPIGFEVASSAPGKATLIAPTGSITSVGPTFTWNGVLGTSYYLLRVSDRDRVVEGWYRPSSLGCRLGTEICTASPDLSLSPGPGYWQVLTWNAAGYGPWSDVRSFTMEIADPEAGVPGPLSPTGAVAAAHPTYTWTAVGGAVLYRLSVRVNGGPATHLWYTPLDGGCVATSECRVVPEIMLENGTAQWQVQAWTVNGHGAWSAVVSLDVSISAPPAPDLVSPDGSASATPSFVWNPAGNAAFYYVRVYDSTGFRADWWLRPEQVGCFADIGACTLHARVTLNDGPGSWEALAWNPTGYSPWPSPLGFVVSATSDVTPPAVAIVAPAGGATVSGTVTVTASASDNVGVAGVQLRVDGAPLGPEDTTSPYAVSWTTTTVGNGSHTLTAVARDAAGNAATSAAVTVTVANAPTISSLSPTSGPVGTSVTVTGTNFTGATAVKFNGTTAIFTVSSATAIQATVPTGATTGAVSVTTAGGTATSSTTFTVVPPPTISSLSPTSGPVGTSVTVSGTNFTGVTAVRFNGTTASFTLSSATTIQATVPIGATTGPVSVTTAGGTATSTSNFTFTTLDVTVPTVSISAPTGGATVLGTVTVAASASDNIGVVGVQFKLDGANLGAEDTLAPFSVSWNSTLASNGSHSLTAVARDAAGNQTTSAGVTVNVSNVAPPSILWSGDHEEGNMSDWYTPSGGGEFNSGGGVSAASTDFAHSGRYSAKATISTPPSPSAVRLFRWAESRANPEAYYGVWFYFPRNYQTSWWFIDQFKSRSCSSCDPDPFWFVQVGNRSNGNMYLRLVWWYGPWPGGTVEGPHAGEFGGRTYEQTIKDLPTGQWVHIEIFLRQSASFGGQIIVWQDGVEILRQDNVKTRYPYMGNEWAPSSYAGSISPSPATIYVDDAVISTTRLGSGISDTTPPTVSLSAPAAGATVSGTVTVSASASDNVEVAGVQFKLDGANLGAEDTTTPFSISWSSAVASNGAHSLSAVARDAAGNTTASAPVSVTVSNTATSCQTSGGSWQSQVFVPLSGTFSAQFNATPSAANIDGVAGLAAGNASAYTDLAAIVRFNSAGNIDARNGGAYSALASIPYASWTTYRVRMVVNVPTHSYSVYVTPSGGTEQAVGLNYAFRSEQAATNMLGALSSFTNGGTLQICDFSVSP